MKSALKYSILALALVLSTSTFAHAGDWDHHPKADDPHCGNTAPEVVPSLALSGLMLLGGSLTVLRARRRQ